MAKKKGRPMKTSLPIVMGNAVIVSGGVTRPTASAAQEREADGEKEKATDEEPSDIFIEWTGEREEDQEEVVSW
jgi:hypothetical protein